ncbi:MAG: hypothetical protein A3K68_04435 [Euryarchaeota archaeon RBG_16_68_13]|nr:MAG: hypothetical protein A3K68_04435 [Euryarchaeota archaeon RBG_16_68_13]
MTEPLTLGAVALAMEGLGIPEQVRGNRVKVATTPENLREAIARATSALACDHLVQISTADNGKGFDLVYHLTGVHRTVIAIAIEVPRDAPEVPSVHDLLPPAGIYERGIHDLLGIVFVGHPALARIILNEDWPEGEYPMRKDWKPHPDRFYGGVPKEET